MFKIVLNSISLNKHMNRKHKTAIVEADKASKPTPEQVFEARQELLDKSKTVSGKS